ncbi:restriction endonuclease [Sulfurimonas sp.]|uniref:restriction endonuclease n=1 Tax=Sulfurimonas sp. TaxID=2022749 RepID=UPI003D0F5A1A
MDTVDTLINKLIKTGNTKNIIKFMEETKSSIEESDFNKIYNALIDYFLTTRDCKALLSMIDYCEYFFSYSSKSDELIDILFKYSETNTDFTCLLRVYSELISVFERSDANLKRALDITKYLLKHNQFDDIKKIIEQVRDISIRNEIFQAIPKSLFEDIILKNVKAENTLYELSFLLWNEARDILDSHKKINFEQYPEVNLAKQSLELNYNYPKFHASINRLIKSGKPTLSLYILNKYGKIHKQSSNAKLYCDSYIEAFIALERYDILVKFYYKYDIMEQNIEFLQHIVKHFIATKEVQNAQVALKKIALLEPKHPFIKEAQYSIDKCNMIQKLSSENIDISAMNDLSGEDFEELLIEKFIFFNFNAKKTAVTGDFGADIVVDMKDGTRFIIQCKRFKSKVNLKAVQEVVASLAHYNGDIGIVITNNEFLSSAISLAQSNGIELWGNLELMKFLTGDISFSKMNEWKE